jgi:hypothetical protein
LLKSVVKVRAHDHVVLHTRNARVDTVINADIELACNFLRQLLKFIKVDASAAVRKQNINELSNLLCVIILEFYQIRSKDGFLNIPTTLLASAKCRFVFERYVLQDDLDFLTADDLIIIDVIALEGN